MFSTGEKRILYFIFLQITRCTLCHNFCLPHFSHVASLTNFTMFSTNIHDVISFDDVICVILLTWTYSPHILVFSVRPTEFLLTRRQGGRREFAPRAFLTLSNLNSTSPTSLRCRKEKLTLDNPETKKPLASHASFNGFRDGPN